MAKPEKAEPPNDAEQPARFIATARERQANENSEAFEAVLRVITPATPAPKTPAQKKPKR